MTHLNSITSVKKHNFQTRSHSQVLGVRISSTLLGGHDPIYQSTMSSDFLQFYKEACYVKVVERLFGKRRVAWGRGLKGSNEMGSFSALGLPLAYGFTLGTKESPSCVPSAESAAPSAMRQSAALVMAREKCVSSMKLPERASTESFNRHISDS